ncbi:MAG: hypothetical protein JWO60_605, partial [Frankiales bacterium]|nr:hypothetical protein [Frankiales bacterium]
AGRERGPDGPPHRHAARQPAPDDVR